MKTINKMIPLSLAILMLVGITGFKQSKKEDVKNVVEASAPDSNTKYEQGYILDGLDHGLIQSPINIVTNNMEDTTKHKVELHYKSSKEDVKNLGHTIQVNYDTGNTISFDNKTFDFKQFHFHTPAEHLIDGITYPMEMHMVHTLQGQKKNETTVYLVIAALFKEGKENPFLNEFMDAIPKVEGEENTSEKKSVDINDLIKQAGKLHYYNYQGSLTTPPYTETVTWLVIKHIFEASPEQIKAFNKLEGNNARHVQALSGRKISSQ